MSAQVPVLPQAGPHDEHPVEGRQAAPLPLWRLNTMRAAYALIGIGLALVKWPLVLDPDADRVLAQGVVDTLLTALSVLALSGLRHPVRMLPVLLFEVMWKLLWLSTVALPAVVAGTTDAAMRDVIVNCALVVPVILVVPWRFAWRQYVSAPGDPWFRRR